MIDQEIDWRIPFISDTEKRARGCTPFGKEIAKMGCNGEICLCDHDLCNNANSYDYSTAILLLALLANICNK